MMRTRTVPKDQLPAIAGEDWIDRNRSPHAEGDVAWVPVKEGLACTREIPERRRYAGRGFFMLGNVAVIHGKRPKPEDVDGIVSFRHPDGILWIDSLEDVTRTPRTEILWGEAGEVCHRESGYVYYLDPKKVMFAQGNRNEKMRMARLISESPAGSRVADMFAGIGYFTIPMAGSGAQVHAMEINPVSFGYLKKNIQENNLSLQVQPEPGDCRALLSGAYDRVVMGHFDAIHMLPQVMPHVHEGSVIHLHSIGTVEGAIREITEGAGFSPTIEVHKVKKYRPHAWHIVQDVTLS
jgi:tRNA wybutosine-synthesizing protein 2